MTRLNRSGRYTPFLLTAFLATSALQAGAVFEDTFDYANNDALRAAYPIVTSAGGNPVNLGTNAGVDPDQPYLSLSNVIVEHDIGTTLTQDWTVSYNVIHTSYQRYTWFAMLNDAGTGGYAFTWNSGSETSYGGKGFVTIEKQTGAVESWNDSSVLDSLTLELNSGHKATVDGGEGMALFEASWDSATSTITISVDGSVLGSVTDSTFNSFSKIQIKGNAFQAYDNIVITSSIPEMSSSSMTISLLALFSCFGLRRRR